MFIKINFSFLTVRTSFRSFLVQNVIIVQKRCRMSCIKDKLALFFFLQKADAPDFPTAKILVKLDDY